MEILIYILFTICLISCIFVIIALVTYSATMEKWSIIILKISGILTIVVTLLSVYINNNQQGNSTNAVEEPIPTALDVYRGKTELEITYKNGEPVDTVVVFK